MTVKQNKLSTGFTLLEILIAMLIISIGLLGVATLQIRGQQFNQVSYFRTQATFLAYDLMDRIRINFETNNTVINPMADYSSEPLQQFVNVGPSGNINQPKGDCEDNPCSSLQLANYDLDNWFYYLRNTLPDGTAKIDGTVQINNNNVTAQYTITIQWKDIADDNDANTNEQQTWLLQLG